MKYNLDDIYNQSLEDTYAIQLDGDGYESRMVYGTKIIKDKLDGSIQILNTARGGLAGTGRGPNTATLAVGGEASPGIVGVTEDWNGVSWVEVADLSTARTSLGGAGDSTAGIVFGGSAPSITGATEEWSSSSNVVKTLTD